MILVLGVGAVALAAPPQHLPHIVSGTVVDGSTTFPYAAVWSDAVSGYVFTAPGRPAAWTGPITLTENGATWTASIGGASADWSVTPLGRPLTEGAYSFVPSSVDWGTGWDSSRMIRPFFFGSALAVATEILIVVYRLIIGGFTNGLRRI